MYEVAARLDPESYFRLARATFAEMALAGVTAVGEFHYLHHGPGGEPYADPNEIGAAMIAAAREAGIRITLLDACYLHGGIGEPLNPVQERFSDGSAEAWAERVGGLADASRAHASARRSTASARSTRTPARPSPPGRPSASARCTRTSPSSRPRTRPASPPTAPRRPRVLDDAGALGPRFTAVHATHLTDADIAALGGDRAAAAVCARPPSATSPTGSARPGRSPTRAPRSRSAPTRTR